MPTRPLLRRPEDDIASGGQPVRERQDNVANTEFLRSVAAGTGLPTVGASRRRAGRNEPHARYSPARQAGAPTLPFQARKRESFARRNNEAPRTAACRR